MDNKSLKIAAIIASLVSACSAGASAPSSQDIESAQVMAALIQAGKIKINPDSGKITIHSSVLELLREAGAVPNVKPGEIQAAGACNSTGGNGGCF